MPLFNLGKKEPTPQSQSFTPAGGALSVKVLGSGCSKCNLLEKYAIETLEELGIVYNLEHVHDYVEIAKYGVMQTPALVVNEKVLVSGRVPTRSELKELLAKQ
ncbi:MAG TPA: thioredoxin family protein [Anaerolineaceae bacterium]|nr:thioredoxin family protein [Anaerolineaceae bacterium]